MVELKVDLLAEDHIKEYYDTIVKKVQEQYDLASRARAKGYEYSDKVETIPVTDLAERTEKLVGPEGIAERFRIVLVENKGDRMLALFQLFREIIEQDWCKIPDKQKRVEQAIKTGLVIMTEGVVVSPLDGLPKVLISKNPDGSEYVDVYFAGPIRAAGGSATVIPLILADYARILLSLDRYKPTKEEVERYVEEIMIYQNEIVSRQYKLKEDEIRHIVNNCPVCINGVPTEEREVSVHRDLERMPTNRIRGGVGLVISEGIALKAMKILKWAKMLNLEWQWLEKIIKVEKKGDQKFELKPVTKYLDGIAAGRPLLAYPSRPGGFRLRYGRARNTATMGKGINPAVMIVLDEFIAVGTHIKIERPGKAAQLFPITTIDGPIVRMKNGTVQQLNSYEEAKDAKENIDRILFLGDILVTLGDFRKSAHPLVPSPFVEEWWKQILAEKDRKHEQIDELNISFKEAVDYSKKENIPLHPKWIWYYKLLEKSELENIVENAINAKAEKNNEEISRIEMDNSKELKKALEKIGFPHKIDGEKIVLQDEYAQAFGLTFGYGKADAKTLIGADILESLSKISGLEIKDKCGTFVGARMGRPEQAKAREMKGNPHVLFPIGIHGGPTRSINKAVASTDKKTLKIGQVDVEVALFKCPKCERTIPVPYCSECNERTNQLKVCIKCGRIGAEDRCKACGADMRYANKRKIDLENMFRNASANLGMKAPSIVKGVRGMISDAKIPEPLEKGILRAKHNIHVFRDGTSRFELLNAPITHFKPKEINLSVEKVKELGYKFDVNNKPIENENQMIEMFPQDIIINIHGGEWMLDMTRFIDDLLEKFYKLPRYYNASHPMDLIGELVIGLAPHTSAGIVARLLGYTKSRLGWGHPYFIMTKRRNVDGDQDSIILLMDALLNFSYTYLANRSGGKMDTPLVFTLALNPNEIDDEVYEMETVKHYPVSFYEETQKIIPPYVDGVALVKQKLGKIEQYTGINYTHETTQFDLGPIQSMYIQMKSMEDKIRRQAKLQFMIEAVDGKDALERVLRNHFFPDIIGNARAFSRQKFRCTKCNSKYRRPPLKGICTKCGNNLILTITEGSVRKYLKIAKRMIDEFDLSNYQRQRIQLVEEEVDSVFKNDKVQQKNLFEFV